MIERAIEVTIWLIAAVFIGAALSFGGGFGFEAFIYVFSRIE